MDAAERIAEHLHALNDTIAAIAKAAGRRADEIKLIAVSKTQDWPAVAAAIQAGQRRFGESTVQDALGKLAHCTDPAIEWHFVGHLQSNKAKAVLQHFAWLHSLDSVALAQRIARLAGQSAHRPPLQVLIEVNVTDDPRKHGISPARLLPFLEDLLETDMTGLQLRGLMTIGPQGGNEPALRHAFAQLRALREQCQMQFGLPGFSELSMGMSDDFAAAIKEGATFLRLGSAIFGERPLRDRAYSRADT